MIGGDGIGEGERGEVKRWCFAVGLSSGRRR